MFTNFQLKKTEKNGNITGYHWALPTPAAVICIIHGIGEYAGRYERMADYFQKSNMAVLAMDLRGHGKSCGKRGHCAPRKEVLKDIDTLLAYARDQYKDTPIVLYGHSMGGNIVLDYRERGSLNESPSAYIVSAPWIRLVKPISGGLYKAVKILSKIAPSLSISSNVSSDSLGNKKSVGDYDKDPMVHGRITALCAVEGFETGKALEENARHGKGNVSEKPFLLMHGAEDRLCSIEGTRKVASHQGENCTYIEWEGLYHEIHNGGKESTGEEVIIKMIDWIKSSVLF